MFFKKNPSSKTLDPVTLELEDGRTVPVFLTRHPRARKMKLRIARASGRVTLTLPPRTPLKLATSFLSDSADWISAELADCLTALPVTAGTLLPVRGSDHTVLADSDRQRGIKIQESQIIVPASDPDLIGARVKRGLTGLAKKQIQDSLDYYAAVMNTHYSGVTITDAKTRWGSCASNGALRFNFRLIMAEPHILDYVVVHELAHRTHMDHSRAFWDLVGDHCPDYKATRRALKESAASLQRYQF